MKARAAAATLLVLALLQLPLLFAKDSFFDSSGVPIHYEIVGEGAPIVFLHGFGGRFDPDRYAEMLRGLPNYRVIGVDVRGFGRSGKPPQKEDYGLELARDYPRLLDHLGVSNAHIIGHSMGGIIALKIAVLYPEKVLSLVLAGQGWLTEEELEQMAAGGRQALAQPDELPDFAQEVVKRHGRHIFSLVASYPELYVTPEALRALAVPVLCVLGEEDPRVERAQAMREHVPGTQVVIIPDRGHGEEIDDPLFGDAVVSFLANLPD